MYETPINIIKEEMALELEGDILKAVQRYGITVDKEELIRAMRYDRNQYKKGFKDGTEQKAKWIPCSERLPEVGSEVLVCFDFKGNRSVYISNFYGDGEFYGLDDEYLTSEGRKYRKAVAWMPLPEPYKEAEDEDSN